MITSIKTKKSTMLFEIFTVLFDMQSILNYLYLNCVNSLYHNHKWVARIFAETCAQRVKMLR